MENKHTPLFLLPAILLHTWYLSDALPAPRLFCQIVQPRGNTEALAGALRCFSLRNSDPSCCWMRQCRRLERKTDRKTEHPDEQSSQLIKWLMINSVSEQLSKQYCVIKFLLSFTFCWINQDSLFLHLNNMKSWSCVYMFYKLKGHWKV